jgi:hypothetical protein
MSTISTSKSRLDRLGEWIEALPPSIRPAVYGAGLIVVFMLWRGAWLVAPIAIVAVLVFSPHPLHAIGLSLSVVALAIIGGAFSGLAYGLVGRRVKDALPGGRAVAGILTVAPYMLLLSYIARIREGVPLWSAPTTVELVISALMALLFGTVMGYSWFDSAKDGTGNSRERAT